MSDHATAAPTTTHPHETERHERRVSGAIVAALLLLSASAVVWGVWRVESVADRLQALPLEIDAAPGLRVEVLDRHVEGHTGPGDSAFFDIKLRLSVTCEGPRHPESLKLDAVLFIDASKPMLRLDLDTTDHFEPNSAQIIETVASPLPMPIAKRAERLRLSLRRQ